jgi:hypothetical protein
MWAWESTNITFIGSVREWADHDAERHESGQRSPSMTYRMQGYWPYWYA